MDVDFLLVNNIMYLILVIVLLGLFFMLVNFLRKKFKEKRIKDNPLLDEDGVLPSEELQSLRQMSYLAMMAAFFIIAVYLLIVSNMYIFYLSLFDVIISLIALTSIDRDTVYQKVIFFFLLPIGSLSYLLSHQVLLIQLFDFLHFIGALVAIKIFYTRFKRYTTSNNLGYTILLLFLIILVSMFFTSYVEHVNLFDAMVMVSNAFTSNGYAILGKTTVGKLNSLVLVWGGYILSGVGTATLTAGILIRYFENRFKELEKKIGEKDKDNE